MSTPVLEIDSEIVSAIRERKEFDSSVLSARQLDLAYVMSHKGEDIAFICSHGDLYINLDPSARHLIALFGAVKDAELVEDLFMKSGTLINEAWQGGREAIALCDLDKFAIACAIHGIPADQYIVMNLRDRGMLFSFLKMSLELTRRSGESDD